LVFLRQLAVFSRLCGSVPYSKTSNGDLLSVLNLGMAKDKGWISSKRNILARDK